MLSLNFPIARVLARIPVTTLKSSDPEDRYWMILPARTSRASCDRNTSGVEIWRLCFKVLPESEPGRRAIRKLSESISERRLAAGILPESGGGSASYLITRRNCWGGARLRLIVTTFFICCFRGSSRISEAHNLDLSDRLFDTSVPWLCADRWQS